MLKHLLPVLPAFLLLISCTGPQTPASTDAKNDNLVNPVANTVETPLAPTPLTTNTPAPDGQDVLAAEATQPASTAVPAIDIIAATASSVPVMTPSATPSPQPAAKWTPAPAPAVMARQPINIRRGPGLHYDVIAGLHAGQRADILNRDPAGDWLQIRIDAQRLGWVFAGVVDTEGETASITVAADIPDPPPTPSPEPIPATPTPKATAATATPTLAPPSLSPKQSVVELGPGAQYPVHADHIIGWGYELVDASAQWDILLYRDVFGVVAHEFWGDNLYTRHPRGIRITFLDCESALVHGTGEVDCAGTEAPVGLYLEDRGLVNIYGDGVGSMMAAGCAVDTTNYHDPQACFIGLGPVDAGHLTDSVVSAMITAQNLNYSYWGAETPDFRQAPFTPYLGQAVRDDVLQQWRWQDPFLQVVPASG